MKFEDLNEAFCNEFKEYLLSVKSNKSSKTTLSQNSALSYFNKLKATIKQAYKEGFLQLITKPTGQGTGLGLSLNYDIIKARGGELRVETKEGEGSEFIIQIRA